MNTLSPTGNLADEKAIHDLFRQMMDGRNKGNGDVFAAPFQKDAGKNCIPIPFENLNLLLRLPS